jgi:uncharacterized protein (TIGR02246 family)
MRNTILLIGLILCIFPVAGFGAEGKQGTDKKAGSVQVQSAQAADEKAIRASAEEFVTAFNKGDAKQIGALWTPDCEYVDETGRIFKGRDAIEKEYAAFFAANPGLKMETSISSVKIMGGLSAVEDGTAIVKNANGVIISQASYTAIHLKDGDTWLMASVRERAIPSLSKRPDFEHLEWLIGDWSAARDSRTLDFRFKWIADKKFIELSYSVRDKDAPARSGIQIIGRDPSSGHVISWTFDSAGGYGQGQWRLLKKGVVIESRGIMPDGALSASSDIVSRIDGDSFSWQSVNRMVAGQRLNNQEPVLLKRNRQ